MNMVLANIGVAIIAILHLWFCILEIFFLSCVLIAGVYAGLTVSRKILFIQALPAVVTLTLVYFSV